MSDETRAIELEIEVAGTPEEVWRAISTGPGIASWYVPHTVEEREGGAATASFGDAPEMQIPGRVAAWDPPRRIVFDGGEGVGGFAFEWLVEAKEGGTCIVRLVNTGFGTGEAWDDQYDGMHEGWKLFLNNLALHMEHFRGQSATSVMPAGAWAVDRTAAWATLTGDLGIPADPAIGEAISVAGADTPPLAGTVVFRAPQVIGLLLDEPAAGTGFIAAEGKRVPVMVSVWSYLYGPDATAVAARDKPRWQAWLDTRAGGVSD